METGLTRCKEVWMCGFQGTRNRRRSAYCAESFQAETKKTKDCTNPSQLSGDYGERDPPVPIPNTEVKPFSADGTWLETTWESRTLPDSMKKELTPNRVGSFLYK